MSTREDVAFLVFDVEAIGDGELISKVKYASDGLSAAEALRKFRDELIEKTGKDVLPPTFVLPISVAVAKVSKDFRLTGLSVLDEPQYRPHVTFLRKSIYTIEHERVLIFCWTCWKE